jgi:Uma2 family endonuclease
VATLLLGERPPELEAWLERRRSLGQDRFDEVWEGVYHVAPSPTFEHAAVDAELAQQLGPRAKRRGLRYVSTVDIGELGDYRVPDSSVHRGTPSGAWHQTAALVVEVVSPGDESMAKFDFYARHEVDEVLVADPARRSIRLWQLREGTYDETGRSDVLDLAAAGLEQSIDWP